MEEERKKRKIENEEENEEEKMEEFFSLIKRTKDVRDRLYNKEKTEKKIDGEREKSIWNPTFQPEDFIEMGKSIHAGPSEKEFIEKKQDSQEATPLPPTPQEKDKASEHLDLNLSL
ncbi:protein NIM1-INTERACTING 1 [Cajanus cajan]|uniref:protein NIM1-INTERACTING 1 n=1 Tax=Cajanus cajan TaxID=3821 RepID=UPI00098DB5D4|nr:protein NIM1-INTERACTING 1 [Cajanus cajan]XP_020213781.1 protein NIM1-INTERACTING 1 [Cajanus cajan]